MNVMHKRHVLHLLHPMQKKFRKKTNQSIQVCSKNRGNTRTNRITSEGDEQRQRETSKKGEAMVTGGKQSIQQSSSYPAYTFFGVFSFHTFLPLFLLHSLCPFIPPFHTPFAVCIFQSETVCWIGTKQASERERAPSNRQCVCVYMCVARKQIVRSSWG